MDKIESGNYQDGRLTIESLARDEAIFGHCVQTGYGDGKYPVFVCWDKKERVPLWVQVRFA
jgi:hypothetical protein